MNKFLLSFLLSFLGMASSFAQCVSLVSGPSTATCGSPLTFTGNAYSNGTSFNFNGGALPAGWTATAHIVGQPCWLGSPDGTDYFWASAVAGQRYIVTAPVDISAGGLVSFEIRFGNHDPNPGCERVDAGEGVYLQYSIDGGVTFTNIQYMAPVEIAGGALGYNWIYFNVNTLPAAALTTATRFRWIQLSNSGASYDNWGLDNITISRVIPVTNHAWNMGDGTVIPSGTATQNHTYAGTGMFTVTYTATLQDGCVSSVNMNVNTSDNIAITCPGNQTVSSSATSCGYVGTAALNPTITGACGPVTPTYALTGATTGTGSSLAGVTFNGGVTTVTWSVTSGATTETCSFTVTVQDATPAVINCGTNVTLAVPEGQCGIRYCYPFPNALDNCGPHTAAIPGYTYLGSIGNNSYYISNVNVNYSTAITDCHAAGGYMAQISSAAENSQIRTWVTSMLGGVSYFIGYNDIEVEGNFVWEDCSPPTYTNWAPGEPNNAGNEDATQVLSSGMWNDIPVTFANRHVLEINGARIVRTAGPAANTLLNVGSYVTSFTSTDNSGNTSSCSFTINVIDNQPPQITCPEDITVISAGGATAVITWDTPTTSDNCAVDNVTVSHTSGSVFNAGTTTVTYTVTDVNGNVTTCSFNVTVIIPVNPPPAPPYLIVEGQDTKTLKVRFGDAAGDEDGYEVYRSPDGVTWTYYTTLPPHNTSAEVVFMDSLNTIPDQRYFYIVRTIRANRRSGFTNSAYDFTYPEQPVVTVLMPACQFGKGKFKATGTHFSNKYRWYASASAVVPFGDNLGNAFDSDVFETEVLQEARTYYVTAKGRKYESKPRLAIVMPVISRPAVNIVGSLNPRACSNELDLAVEPVEGAAYFWTFNGFVIAGANSHTYRADKSGMYQVFVSNGSCATPSAQISVVTNFKPMAIIQQGQEVNFCANGVISAQLPTLPSAAAYEWYKDGVFVASGVELSVASSGVYRLKVTEFGCENTAEISVRVSTFPSDIKITSDNETLCEGTSVALTTDAFSGVTYQWYRDGRLFATTNTPTVTVRKGGDYQVALTYSETCSRLSTTSVFVNEVKTIRLSQTFDGVTMNVIIPDGATVASASWTIDGEPAPSLNNMLTFKPTKNGVYVLSVLWSNGCESSMKTNVILGTLGTDSEETDTADGNIFVYPNPTKGKVFVNFGKLSDSQVSYIVTDNLGRTVASESRNLNENKLEIDLNGVPAGMYLLNVRFDSGEKTFRIIRTE